VFPLCNQKSMLFIFIALHIWLSVWIEVVWSLYLFSKINSLNHLATRISIAIPHAL
jgi:hypothetical protein